MKNTCQKSDKNSCYIIRTMALKSKMPAQRRTSEIKKHEALHMLANPTFPK